MPAAAEYCVLPVRRRADSRDRRAAGGVVFLHQRASISKTIYYCRDDAGESGRAVRPWFYIRRHFIHRGGVVLDSVPLDEATENAYPIVA